MVHSRPVFGVVLAAGQSLRMGRPKALLRCWPGGETFVERVARTLILGGVDEILVIGRSGDETLRARAVALPHTRFVANAMADRGQLSSVVAGIDAAERDNAGAVLVMPVDMPLVRVGTIAAALDAFAATGAPIVRVTHTSRHGHPVIFAAAIFDDLRSTDMAIGAKDVLRRHAASVHNLEVDDPGVLRDIDLPVDYQTMFGCDPD